jgi:predicted enzyme related to lactoylglutathione lyase
MKHAISWFEIPATDIDRAQKFYETILGVQLVPMDFGDMQMRMFPLEDPMTGIGGTLVKHDNFYKTSATDGPLIYLNGNPDVQNVADKFEAAGGKVIVPKTKISDEYGYMAVFIDTEGNRIAVHSVPEKYLSGNG